LCQLPCRIRFCGGQVIRIASLGVAEEGFHWGTVAMRGAFAVKHAVLGR
jgi:hypothetical protein